MNNVFTYWEGPRPAYIDLCFEIMAAVCKCSKLEIITPETAESFLEGSGLDDRWKSLNCIAHRCDCIRVGVIKARGGWWIDADTVLLLDPVTAAGNFKQFLYSRWKDGRVLNGYFFSPANGALVSEWLERVNYELARPGEVRQWTTFGEPILSALVYLKFAGSREVHEISRETFLPINIDRIPGVFFEPVDFKPFLRPQSVAVGLNHSYFCDNHKEFVKQARQQVLGGENLINRLMKKALLCDS